jgi:hypothetical protein
MRKLFEATLILLMAFSAEAALASDACSTRAISAAADVHVSDGSSFSVETYFQSKEIAAIRHLGKSERLTAVEGPFGWAEIGEKAELGSELNKVFALGHQFHALLLYFDEIAGATRQGDVRFAAGWHQATTGDYPYGGTVHLIRGDDESHPMGLLFELPEDTVISVEFSDWREAGERSLPYRLAIDDGQRKFDYLYTDIDLTARSPLWYFEAVDDPAIDEVQVYRLHRKLLAAHCLADARMMADLSAPEVLTASRGELQYISNQSMLDRFTALFEVLNYSAYHDLVPPSIELSADASLGWIGAGVRAEGTERASGAAFENQWAWVMMVRKVDGRWLHAGNASNLKE